MHHYGFHSYPTPTPRNGVLLTEVHRTTSYLTKLIGPFYNNAVVIFFLLTSDLNIDYAPLYFAVLLILNEQK